MNIRPAKLDDAEIMLAIYSPYIFETPISFETEVPSIEEFRNRIQEKEGRYPWLLCEVDNRVVGYAYAGAFRTRCAYAWSAESSIYVDRSYHGKGVGQALYSCLFQILKEQGVVNVIGGMTMPNEKSQKLHERFGFVQVACFKNVGFKLGRWWDVGYWQLQLQKMEKAPQSLAAPKLLSLTRQRNR